MKFYEVARKSIEPFLPPLYRNVRLRLLREIRIVGIASPLVLDVGGRKSPYTIGVAAEVTILDLPRNTEMQTAMNLGINDGMIAQLKRRRSNIDSLIYGDMTDSDLPSESYDIVISVEVLEHVEEDEKFVSEVYRVLKPGGRFIMTTPNGDYLENRNPDHKRHYKKKELSDLLSRHFTQSEVEYAILGGYFHRLGLRSWSARRPLQTLLSAFANTVNLIESSDKGIKNKAIGTHHLFAVATKSIGAETR